MAYDIDDEGSPFISISDEEYAEMQAKIQQAKAKQVKFQGFLTQYPSLQEAIKPDFYRLYKEARTWKSKLCTTPQKLDRLAGLVK